MDEPKEKKITVGAMAHDMMQKKQDPVTYRDIGEAATKDLKFVERIHEEIEKGKKVHDGDFCVIIMLKKERIMKTVIRPYFFHRKSYPTPTWDQTVYRYHRLGDRYELEWTIPAKDISQYMRDFPLEIPKTHRELLGYVLDFYSGELDKKAYMLNNEHLTEFTKA